MNAMNFTRIELEERLTAMCQGFEFEPRDGALFEDDAISAQFVPIPEGASGVCHLDFQLLPSKNYTRFELEATQQARERKIVRRARSDANGRGRLRYLLMDVPCTVQVVSTATADTTGESWNFQVRQLLPLGPTGFLGTDRFSANSRPARAGTASGERPPQVASGFRRGGIQVLDYSSAPRRDVEPISFSFAEFSSDSHRPPPLPRAEKALADGRFLFLTVAEGDAETLTVFLRTGSATLQAGARFRILLVQDDPPARLELGRVILESEGEGVLAGTLPGIARAQLLAPDGKPLGSIDLEPGDAGNVASVPSSDSSSLVCVGVYGSTAVAACANGSLQVWDLEGGQCVGLLEGHTGGVNSVVFSPDGTTLASASDDRTIRLWDARTCQPKGPPLEGHTERVTAVVFSPDGAALASASDDKTIRLWDASTGEPQGPPLEGHAGGVNSVVISPDGTTLASGSEDKAIRLWDAGTGQPLGLPLEGHTGGVTTVAFSPDGATLVSGGRDGTIRRWDARTGRPKGPPLEGHTDVVPCVGMTVDGRCVVSGGERTLRVWDLESGRREGTFSTQGRINHFVLAPGGHTVVVCERDRLVLVDLHRR